MTNIHQAIAEGLAQELHAPNLEAIVVPPHQHDPVWRIKYIQTSQEGIIRWERATISLHPQTIRLTADLQPTTTHHYEDPDLLDDLQRQLNHILPKAPT